MSSATSTLAVSISHHTTEAQNHSGAKARGLIAAIAIMVEFDPKRHTQSTILSLIREAYARSTRDLSSPQPVPCRRLILPIVFDHPALQEAEDRYMKLQRSKAAYLPDNVHYVQQNNGLGSRQAVLDILRRSRFVIVAVGFMTGLPLLLPLNPIDRLTAQKHNPTRIYTPAGAVGVGGGLFCIYPAEQPGGYMIVARTIPVWDQFSLRNGFGAGKPWLCEPFDLVEFREVSIEEYGQIEDEFKAGTYRVDIRESELDVGLEVSREREAYKTDEVRRFLERQGKAVEEMQKLEEKLLAEWQAEQATSHPSGGDKEDDDDDDSGNPGERVVSPHDGKVWKILVAAGDRVSVGQELLVLEAMKMEIKVTATAAHDGMVVDRLVCDEGVLVQAGRTLMRLSRMS